jgi:hypothetical protein
VATRRDAVARVRLLLAGLDSGEFSATALAPWVPELRELARLRNRAPLASAYALRRIAEQMTAAARELRHEATRLERRAARASAHRLVV